MKLAVISGQYVYQLSKEDGKDIINRYDLYGGSLPTILRYSEQEKVWTTTLRTNNVINYYYVDKIYKKLVDLSFEEELYV